MIPDDEIPPIPCPSCGNAGNHLAAIVALDIDPDERVDLLIDHLAQLFAAAERRHPGAKAAILQALKETP